MPTDRFVTFPEGKYPTRAAVGKALRAYVGEAATVEWWPQCGRWGVTFASKPTRPAQAFTKRDVSCTLQDERWFEVFVARDQFDVMTRSQDDFVCAVADGFVRDGVAALLAHGGQTSDRVWTVAVRCAGALDGTTEEQLRADIDGRKGAAKASEWGTVAAFLGDVLAATDTAGVDATVTRHGVAIKALPDRVQKLCTSTAIFHRMTLRIAGARDGDVLKQIHANLASFVQSGKLGKVQAEALTNLMNERAERLTIAAQDQAA